MAASRNLYTPLRYPGGKGKFSFYIKEIFEENFLLDGHYMEPYAGGAGVALDLLINEYVATIHINDADPAIYSFWKSAVSQTEELCRKITDTPVTMDNWHTTREILKSPLNHSILEVGFAAFFQNRTNRSGILNAGVIGGKAQSGKWKLTERFNKEALIKRIQRIGAYKDRIKVYNLDALELLDKSYSILPEKSLIYLDPPYYVKGAGLYRNFYSHDDHVEIATRMRSISRPWIISYDNVEEIKTMYNQFRQDEYFLSYTAQTKKTGSEVMIYGPSITIPAERRRKSIS